MNLMKIELETQSLGWMLKIKITHWWHPVVKYWNVFTKQKSFILKYKTAKVLIHEENSKSFRLSECKQISFTHTFTFDVLTCHSSFLSECLMGFVQLKELCYVNNSISYKLFRKCCSFRCFSDKLYNITKIISYLGPIITFSNHI